MSADFWWKPIALASAPKIFTASGPACVRDFQPLYAGCPRARIELAAGEWRAQVSTEMSEPGTLWHRLGGNRRGDGLLRLRLAIFIVSQTVPRPAHRVPPTGAGKTGMDDH